LVRDRPFGPDRQLEPADVVAWLEALCDALRVADMRLLSGGGPGFDRQRSARVVVDGRDIGSIGQISATAAAHHGAGPAVGFEIDLATLLGATRRSILVRPVSRFPSSSIDLAFVVGEAVAAGDVLRTLREAGGELLEDVVIFDTFRSDAIGPGRVSIAFSLRFRAPDRTLTDAEVADLRTRAIAAVVRAHGAELRG
jgi:phenylalanyl-tRNA synthetase beta chain